MSGGHFDYAQYHISDIYESIEDYLEGRELDDDDVYDILHDDWMNEDERNYISEHKHTIPNRYEYSLETIVELWKGVGILKQAEVYAQRIDWLFSGDDGEESFRERLREDLNKLSNVCDH